MKKYSGQAIAIIMIVLVVATVIGASLYSRMIQNSGEIVDTRESQRALEQADSILDAFISSDLGILQTKLMSLLQESDGTPILYSNIGALESGFFEEVPAIETPILDSVDIDWCDSETDSNSSIEVTIEYADENSPINYDVGDVMAINFSGVSDDIPASCVINLGLTPSGDGSHLFSLKYVYMKYSTGEVKTYALDDMLLYCATTGDVLACGEGDVAPTTSIAERIKFPGQIEISNSTLTGSVEGYDLYEIRLIPLKEKIGVTVLPDGCGDLFNNYRIRAKVNCNGDVREKQVVIPSINNMGYSSLFDYTIYNSNGTLSPN